MLKKLSIAIAASALAMIGSGAVLNMTGGNAAVAQSVAENGDALRAAEARRIRLAIQNDPVAPTIAPHGHDVTIVMFSDYQCPYCRKLHVAVDALLREDSRVKILYRDLPLFGVASVEAARAAIASTYQGKHGAFHDALMKTQGKLTSPAIRAAADKAGVNWTRLQADQKKHGADIDASLSRSKRYAAMMGLSGTPALLVNSYLIPGAVDLTQLRRVVARAREQGG